MANSDERDPVPEALKRFIWDIQSMVELAESEREILLIGRDLMMRLLGEGDWLPAAFREPESGEGRQFEIYSDAMARFCVVSTILDGAASLAIEQPGIWELMGVVSGSIDRRVLKDGDSRLLLRGAVETARSTGADAFQLSGGAADRTAIAIHVYGGDIGRLRRMQLAADGARSAALDYANCASAPPYDIFSIQTKIRD